MGLMSHTVSYGIVLGLAAALASPRRLKAFYSVWVLSATYLMMTHTIIDGTKHFAEVRFLLPALPVLTVADQSLHLACLALVICPLSRKAKAYVTTTTLAMSFISVYLCWNLPSVTKVGSYATEGTSVIDLHALRTGILTWRNLILGNEKYLVIASPAKNIPITENVVIELEYRIEDSSGDCQDGAVNAYIGIRSSGSTETFYWSSNTRLISSGKSIIPLNKGKFTKVTAKVGRAYIAIAPWKDEQIKELSITRLAITANGEVVPGGLLFPRRHMLQ